MKPWWPVLFLISLPQLARRNLNAYQKGLIALQAEELIKEEAKERQKLSNGKGQKKGKGVVILPHLYLFSDLYH